MDDLSNNIMKGKNKRLLRNDSSDQEGFQQSEIRVIQTTHKSLAPNIIEPIKINNPKQIILQKFTYSCFSVYNNINLFAYPNFIDFGLEDTIVKMQKNKNKDNQQNTEIESKDLGEFLRGGNFKCIYNKFYSKVDYKLDMTNYYKSFEDYLEYFNKDNYREFAGKDNPNADDIEFSSNFQSGNLQYAFSHQNTYYLLLQNDVNTHGFNQWFYFRIRNKRKCKVKLMILNICKPIELIKNAMGISVLSLQQKSFCRKYWTEGGTNLKFYKNGFKRKTKSKTNNQYYTLEFDYEFKFQSDSVYFAMNIPYTYTKAMNLINTITSVRRQNIIINVKTLGTTVSQNKLYSLQFSKKTRSIPLDILKGSVSTADEDLGLMNKQMLVNSSRSTINRKKKKSIIFIGRQHPCQTNSSYVLQGIINYLSQQSQVSLFLLQTYDIYIIPISNPDGVIHGLSRTNLCGYDINKQWINKNKQRSKEAYAIASYIEYLNQNTEIKYIFDLHSTHKKLGTFGHFSQDNVEIKSFAWFLQETNSNFIYSSCLFEKNKSRQVNLRNFAYNLGIKNSITIQISYFGKLQHGLYRRYNTKQLHDIGIAIIKALSQFSEVDVSKVIINNFIKSNLKQNVLDNIQSQSEPEDDYLQERERVKIILSGRRQKQSNQSKGFNRNTSPTKPKLLKKISSTFTKTLGNVRQEDNKMIQSPKRTHTASLQVFAQKTFKPYSKQQILRDDSFTQESPSPTKRRFTTQKSNRSPSRLYFWDESKYNVSRPISYPTSLHPYLQRLSYSDVKSFDNSPVRRRNSTIAHNHKHSLTTEFQLQKVIIQSNSIKYQKQHFNAFQIRRKSRANRNANRKFFPTTMKGTLSSSFYY